MLVNETVEHLLELKNAVFGWISAYMSLKIWWRHCALPSRHERSNVNYYTCTIYLEYTLLALAIRKIGTKCSGYLSIFADNTLDSIWCRLMHGIPGQWRNSTPSPAYSCAPIVDRYVNKHFYGTKCHLKCRLNAELPHPQMRKLSKSILRDLFESNNISTENCFHSWFYIMSLQSVYVINVIRVYEIKFCIQMIP